MAATIEIGDPQLLEALIGLVEGQLSEATTQRYEADLEVKRLETHVVYLRNKLDEINAPTDAEFSETGRLKKGEAMRLITDFLRKRNGTGASLKVIQDTTGASYASTYRVLRTLLDLQQVVQDGDSWRWAH